MANSYHLASAQITSTAGPANSSWIDLQVEVPGEMGELTVHGASAHSSTVVVQVDATSTGAARDLIEQNSTSVVVIPGGGSRPIGGVGAPRMRLQSRGGEASTRTFEVFTE